MIEVYILPNLPRGHNVFQRGLELADMRRNVVNDSKIQVALPRGAILKFLNRIGSIM